MNLPFVLGTAQLGMDYGIVNSSGLMYPQVASKILNYFLTQGVDFIDTAVAYGQSLERIKNYIQNHQPIEINIINKFSLCDDFEELFERLNLYLEDTKLGSFYALLLHDANKLCKTNYKRLLPFLKKIKEEGLVKKIGASVYEVEDFKKCTSLLPIEIIQCPINPFNQRFLQEDVQKYCQAHSIELHARSLFLQGVLLSNTLPPLLESLSYPWQLYKNTLKDLNFSPLTALLGWAKQQSIVDKWVIGVTTLKEGEEIITAYKQLSDRLPIVDLKKLDSSKNPYVDPRNWQKE